MRKAVLGVMAFDVGSKVMLGVMGIVLIRYMPEGEYARYTFALALASFFTGALTSAFNRIFIVGYERLGMRDAAPAFLGVQLLLLAVLAALCLPVAGVAQGLYLWAVALVVATCLSEFARTVYQQELRFNRFSAVEVGRSALSLAGVWVLAAVGGAALQARWVLLLQASAMLAVFLVAVRRRRLLPGMARMGEAARLARSLAAGEYRYLFGYFAVLALLSQMDVFLLRALVPADQLAAYGAAFRYYVFLSLALNSLHAVLLPLMQRVASPAEQNAVLARHFRMLTVFAPAVLLGIVASRWVLPWLDRGRYPESVPVFAVLAVSAIVSFALSPYVHVLMRFGDFRFLLGLTCAGLVMHVALNLHLIRTAGVRGAAWATLVTYASINGAIWLRTRQRGPGWWRAAAAGSAAAPGAA